jgi:hypothetical protein
MALEWLMSDPRAAYLHMSYVSCRSGDTLYQPLDWTDQPILHGLLTLRDDGWLSDPIIEVAIDEMCRARNADDGIVKPLSSQHSKKQQCLTKHVFGSGEFERYRLYVLPFHHPNHWTAVFLLRTGTPDCWEGYVYDSIRRATQLSDHARIVTAFDECYGGKG